MSATQAMTVLFRRIEIEDLILGIDAALGAQIEDKVKQSLHHIKDVLKEAVKAKARGRTHRAAGKMKSAKAKAQGRTHRATEKIRCPLCHTIAVDGRCPAAACSVNELKDLNDSTRTA